MSGYMQRLFSRAGIAPAPAGAPTSVSSATPAARLVSPVAEADQRLNLPGFETAPFEAMDEAAEADPSGWESPADAPSPRLRPAGPVDVPYLRPLPQPESREPAARRDIVTMPEPVAPEPLPAPVAPRFDLTPVAPVHIAEPPPAAPVFARASPPLAEPDRRPIAEIVRVEPQPVARAEPVPPQPAPFAEAPMPQRPAPFSPVRPNVAEPQAEAAPRPAAGPLPLPQPRPAAEPARAEPAPVFERTLPLGKAPAAPQEAPDPEPRVVIRELIVEINKPQPASTAKPPVERPRTAEAASLIGPLPVRRRSVGIFGMRRR